MGIFIGIGNYIGRKNTFLTNKDPSNIYYNLITEKGGNILTEMYNLILRDLNNIASEDSLIIISEDGRVIIRDEFVQPIASYRCYDKTNDDSDRDVLTDLTGNGHDIQLYNFAFSGGSGYGKYNENFNNLQYNNNAIKEKSATKVIIYNTSDSKTNIYLSEINPAIGTYTYGNYILRINGLNDNEKVNMLCIYGNDFNERETIQLYNGDNYIKEFIVNVTESNSGYVTFFDIWSSEILNKEITFEILPEYQGALVSDGIDDYGLCENFPILTKEKGYTVCAIRNHINNKGTLVSKRTTRSSEGGGDQIGAFQVERYYGKQPSAFSFGTITNLNSFSNDIFIFQKSNYYCNLPISVGRYKDYVDLTLFSYYKSSAVGSFALYALEIYDRDLTDEEIAKVKSRMIAEYEAKTGNKYEEETA